MGKIRARKDTNKLFFDFRYKGKRFREQTLLDDTPRNRKQMEKLMERIDAKIILDELDYEAVFPQSRNIATYLSLKKEHPVQRPVEPMQPLPNPGGVQAAPGFSSFTDQWFKEIRIQWRQSHTDTVSSIIERSLKPAFEETPVNLITKADIMRLRTELAERKGRGGNTKMSPKTINSHMAILRMICDEAADRYEFDTPYRNIKPLKLQRTHIEPFSLAEVEKIIASVREDYRQYYTVRFYTGMRTGEIDGLRWEYVDFNKREILIRETRVQGRKEYTKTDGSQREIPMLGPVYEALKTQFEGTGQVSPYVFCNRNGEPLEHNNVTKRVWYPLLKRLGLKKRRPYQTRHTAATLLLASGENPEWVARLLGHSSTEMLFKVYSRYIPNLTRMDGSAFERLLTSGGAGSKSSMASTKENEGVDYV